MANPTTAERLPLDPDRLSRHGQPKRPVSVKLHPDQYRQLDQQAERLGCRKSDLIRALIRHGLEQLEEQ